MSPSLSIRPIRRSERGEQRTRALSRSRSWSLAGVLVASFALAAPLAAQEVKDQVWILKAKGGALTVESGTVTENGLERIVLQQGGREVRIDSATVERVTFGEVPPAYRDGLAFWERSDWENAIARLRIAATDADARPPVQASARLLAAESLLAWGAVDPAHLREAALEAERFLQAFPNNRELPRARMVQARATWLSGDAASAAGQLRALWEEARGGTKPGYDKETALQAGLWALRASLEAKDTLAAREIATGLETDAAAALDALSPQAAGRTDLERVRATASLGEGFALLAGGQARQAASFFEPKARELAGLPGDSEAAYGYGAALLAEGRAAEAKAWLARASALGAADKDRIADALLALAECAKALPPTSELDPKIWLREIVATYGDTPAARVARTKT